MKNIQIIDGAQNCVYDIFSATDEEFALVLGNKTADEAAREAGYDDAHDAKKGRGDSRVNIYNDKTTEQKWIWDGKKGSGKEQL